MAVREANAAASERRQSNVGLTHARHGGVQGGPCFSAPRLISEWILDAGAAAAAATGTLAILK